MDSDSACIVKQREMDSIPHVYFRKRDSHAGIDIIDLSLLQQVPPDAPARPDQPHRIVFNMLVFIEEGEGEHFLDFERIQFGSSSLYFINRGQVHAFDTTNAITGKAILYTDDFIDALQANMRIPLFINFNLKGQQCPVLQLNNALRQSVIRLMDELQQELKRAEPDNGIAMSLFSAMLQMLVREKTNPEQQLQRSEIQTFGDFMNMIEQQAHETRDANRYADALNITYKTLNLLSKRVSGMTAKSHIDQYLILEAKRRLIIDHSDIATVGYDLGFDDPTNFTKFFKRLTGQTPKQFKV